MFWPFRAVDQLTVTVCAGVEIFDLNKVYFQLESGTLEIARMNVPRFTINIFFFPNRLLSPTHLFITLINSEGSPRLLIEPTTWLTKIFCSK